MFAIQKTSTRKVVHRVMLAVVLIALAVSMLPQPTQAADLAQTACVTKHTVVAGETLSSIASEYGITWQELADANNLTDPYTIYVGQVLCIPEGAETPEDADDSSESTASGTGPRFDVEFVDDVYIRIGVAEYAANQSHLVKAGEFVQRWAFTRLAVIDRFRTDKNGNADVLVRLPQDYRDVPLIICLKNAFTDKTQCGYFDPLDN